MIFCGADRALLFNFSIDDIRLVPNVEPLCQEKKSVREIRRDLIMFLRNVNFRLFCFNRNRKKRGKVECAQKQTGQPESYPVGSFDGAALVAVMQTTRPGLPSISAPRIDCRIAQHIVFVSSQ